MIEILNTGLRVLLVALLDILPIILVLVVFQWLAIRRPFPNLRRTALGFVYVALGLVIFLEGLELALFPLGTLMADQLTDASFIFGAQTPPADVDWKDYYWVYIFAVALGFTSSIAEPAVIAVAMKVRDVSGGTISLWGLRLVVALGVALGLIVGTVKLVTGLPLHYFMIPAYLLLIVQTWLAPRSIIPIAYDSGGVTTSIVTVPLVTALGLGLAEAIPGRSPLLDGFGLVAFACLFPIMTVMGYAQLSVYSARRAGHGSESRGN
ncbi:membrane protein [Thiohalobacter sp. COW1]|uniref:Uridylyltransferase n=1 Tax=Thiohalobacter thiocyanaticus TaxID=585455 RepID=A0A1Z4VPJ8_9GAMM|nr:MULTISPECIES: DUF1538 domain-containing protein [Thiohalobacter]BAZ93352.1 uridylyltransferase [Thiohalobacter thiocyanaticus]BCO31605.1 membrane protein [Thiohalobacter sp. COW1]